MRIELGVCPVCGGPARVVRSVEICADCPWMRDRHTAMGDLWDALRSLVARAIGRPL